jgi:hypothetical protein
MVEVPGFSKQNNNISATIRVLSNLEAVFFSFTSSDSITKCSKNVDMLGECNFFSFELCAILTEEMLDLQRLPFEVKYFY